MNKSHPQVQARYRHACYAHVCFVLLYHEELRPSRISDVQWRHAAD